MRNKRLSARSFLFVPADREDMLAKAAGRGADALIVDLEDAVAISAKEEARAVAGQWLAEGLPRLVGGVWVRVNNHTSLLEGDLASVAVPGVSGIFMPKVESPEQLTALATYRETLSMRIVAMIESAAGILNADRIADSGLVDRLAMGEVDLAADLGMRPDREDSELLSIRVQLVVASAAADLPSPIGPVFTDFRDLEGLRRSTEALRRLGLLSRPAIHPAQVAIINEVFTPSSSEVEDARRLVDTFERAEAEGRGVIVDEHGRMIDEAVVCSARSILAVSELARDESLPDS